MSEKSELLAAQAEQYFLTGYTCTQAVIAAFKDEPWFKDSGLTVTTAMKISSSLGGGMGRLREVCGTMTAVFMLAGLAYGFDAPVSSDKVKADHYNRIQELAARFRATEGSIICRELLGLAPGPSSPKPAPRTAEYYSKRPCPKLCALAAELFATYLEENPPIL